MVVWFGSNVYIQNKSVQDKAMVDGQTKPNRFFCTIPNHETMVSEVR